MVWRPNFETDYAIGYDATGRALGHRRRKKADAAGSLDRPFETTEPFWQASFMAKD
jgi:hypothetical protein